MKAPSKWADWAAMVAITGLRFGLWLATGKPIRYIDSNTAEINTAQQTFTCERRAAQ